MQTHINYVPAVTVHFFVRFNPRKNEKANPWFTDSSQTIYIHKTKAHKTWNPRKTNWYNSIKNEKKNKIKKNTISKTIFYSQKKNPVNRKCHFFIFNLCLNQHLSPLFSAYNLLFHLFFSFEICFWCFQRVVHFVCHVYISFRFRRFFPQRQYFILNTFFEIKIILSNCIKNSLFYKIICFTNYYRSVLFYTYTRVNYPILCYGIAVVFRAHILFCQNFVSLKSIFQVFRYLFLVLALNHKYNDDVCLNQM